MDYFKIIPFIHYFSQLPPKTCVDYKERKGWNLLIEKHAFYTFFIIVISLLCSRHKQNDGEEMKVHWSIWLEINVALVDIQSQSLHHRSTIDVESICSAVAVLIFERNVFFVILNNKSYVPLSYLCYRNSFVYLFLFI